MSEPRTFRPRLGAFSASGCYSCAGGSLRLRLQGLGKDVLVEQVIVVGAGRGQASDALLIIGVHNLLSMSDSLDIVVVNILILIAIIVVLRRLPLATRLLGMLHDFAGRMRCNAHTTADGWLTANL